MLALLVLVTVALASAHHGGEHFEGEKVFRVNVEDENHINIIRELASTTQIDFWKPDSVTQIKPHSTVDFRVKAEDTVTVENVLKQNELQYKVLISNLRNVVEAQFDSRVRATGHSYEKYNKWETVGKAGQNKPAIFMDCGFHAREWISPAFCQWFVREAVRTYGREIQVTELLDKLDFYVLPVLNIDGYIYTWTKSRFWRKTR
ncbi:carboxypeptidase B1, partial [Homo sapiens]